MRIFILGGDGFCGWPTALHLSSQGHEIFILDNLSRRRIDLELGSSSLTPISRAKDRIAAWHELHGERLHFCQIDLALEFERLQQMICDFRPDAVIHFAEQRAAPYSMRSPAHKRYTIENNQQTTHNLLAAIVESGLDVHVVHLGTMGVYGYDGANATLPEGYVNVTMQDDDGDSYTREILYPTNPGSIYHLSKSMDQLLFQFYAKNDRLRITDLHQGIVWGTQTDETLSDERLINRFDYDGDYGTVLNRFLVQATLDKPLTVYGSGGQTRAFIHIRDTVRCIELALKNPPDRGDRVRIRNQIAEFHRIRELAERVSGLSGVPVHQLKNPRIEPAENRLQAHNTSFAELGFEPLRLSDELLKETISVASSYADRAKPMTIHSRVQWTRTESEGATSPVRDACAITANGHL